MSLEIFFIDDIINRVTALTLANVRAMRWARDFGADARDVAIAQAGYEAALLDVAVSFGLHRPGLLVALRDSIEPRT